MPDAIIGLSNVDSGYPLIVATEEVCALAVAIGIGLSAV